MDLGNRDKKGDKSNGMEGVKLQEALRMGAEKMFSLLARELF